MIATAFLVTTIAVMPFKDLSGGKGHVGEAIRETVTSDLKDAGLKVVERGNIDKVIAEQNLQAKKNDLDMAASIRVGTLLGATMIVAGAYQRASSQVRLTARFVDVATGEIKGSAKVDGSTSDLFKLQDRISAALCKSAGLGAAKVQHFAKRVRPKVKSFKAIELYGDAVVQTDDKKKLELLKLSLDADPQMVYASRDLDALEKAK
jgi:TolB-like protein